jgi:Zn-dependent protease with chaperone function
MKTEAIYSDGITRQRQQAQAELAVRGLMLSVNGGPSFLWDYRSIRSNTGGEAAQVFTREQNDAPTGERLEIAAGPFTLALIARCGSLTEARGGGTRSALKVAGWMAAAVLLLAALVFYGIPALSSRLAVMVPWSTETALGAAVEGQVMAELGGGTSKVCAAGKDTPGKRALAAMVSRLSAQAVLPGPLDVKVLDSPVQNAFALPGGRIVFMRGLIERAQGPDEVAGVLAHEMGHVAHRDAMRGMIHAGGISFLVGALFGDFTGAGALVIASRYLLTSRYSRENEAQADTFAIDVMTKAGGDVRALARFLERAASAPGERQLELLLTHPVTADRVAEITRRAGDAPVRPLLSAEEWLALKSICRE